jgi:PAS domain S-box-containing protein
MVGNLKFSQQNLLIIIIPLTFHVVSSCVMLVALAGVEQQFQQETHLRTMVASINGLLNQLIAACSSEFVYEETHASEDRMLFRDNYEECLKTSRDLRNKLTTDSTTDNNMTEVLDLVDNINNALIQCQGALDTGNIADTVSSVKEFRPLIARSKQVSAKTIRQMENEQQEAQRLEQRGRLFVVLLVFGGGLLNFTITIFLVVSLSRSNNARLEALAANINALSRESDLAEELKGDDEFAELDRILHQVHDTLGEARRREKAMVDNASEVICSINPRLRFSQVNGAALRVFMMEKGLLLGRPVVSIVLPEDQEYTVSELTRAAKTEGSISFESRIIRPDGSIRDIQWNVASLEGEQTMFCVAHDISDRKEAERLKQEVVAMVSHDLRAPLTSLELTLNILSAGGLGELTEKGKDRVSKAESSVSRLVSIINDLIDAERFESGSINLDLEMTSMERLINESVALIESSAQSKNIKIQTQSNGLQVYCDGQRIARVLTNLLSNAVKFSHPNSVIQVTSESTPAGIATSVIDTGRGIPESKLHSVFDRWKQVERADEKEKGGSGLGLAICKSLIEAHGGAMSVQSKEGVGSIFTFVLPHHIMPAAKSRT